MSLPVSEMPLYFFTICQGPFACLEQFKCHLCPSQTPPGRPISCSSLCLFIAPQRFFCYRAWHPCAVNLPMECEFHEARGCVLLSLVSLWPSTGPGPSHCSMWRVSHQWTDNQSDGPERIGSHAKGGTWAHWAFMGWTRRMPGEFEGRWEKGSGSP